MIRGEFWLKYYQIHNLWSSYTFEISFEDTCSTYTEFIPFSIVSNYSYIKGAFDLNPERN
jgi:hypothetical protein